MSDRIAELAAKINQARNEYYNGQSQISDQVYDALVDELAELDPKNLAVIGIGAEPISSWEKYTHKVILGSLNKCQTQDEFQTWFDKYMDAGDQMLLTMKLDGLSVSLIYENGVLTIASSRGSGTIGEKITPNVARMIGVPLRLNKKINATVRGEILLSKENLAKYFSSYSNSRNGASGISRRFDGEGCDKLSVLAYQLMTDDIDFNTQEEQFKILQDLGFTTPTYHMVNTADEILKLKNDYQETLRDQYSFELDGLVIHNNNMEKQAQFGFLNGKPYGSIAYKFDSIAREGYVSDIIIQTGNSGRLTPVAVFNPKVSLMGAEVEKASLHNFSNIEELGVGIGATVLVCRSNDVIPFVEEVITLPGQVFPRPTHCPECGTPVVELGEYMQCPNTATCPAQVLGRLLNWIKELNVLEWGESVLTKLVDSGKVSTVADLYTLSVSDLANLDRMGQKSAQKCYDTLHANMEVPLEVILGGLSIPMIGQSTIKLVMAAGFDTLNKINACSVANFENIQGIGPTKATSLFEGLKDNEKLLTALLNNGVKVKEIVIGKLTGKSVCFTGTMANKRTVLEKMAIDAGGTVKGSVGKGLTFLVINDLNSTSSKAVNAKKLGTKLVSEDEFLEMVGI